jgi:hypothetical protein
MDLVWDQGGVLMPNEDAVRGSLPREFEPLLNLVAAAVLGMHWKTLERMARNKKYLHSR